jgi:hypothetical protein
VEEELAAEAAADEEAKQQKREQIAAEERRLQELEQRRHAEVGSRPEQYGKKGVRAVLAGLLRLNPTGRGHMQQLNYNGSRPGTLLPVQHNVKGSCACC